MYRRLLWYSLPLLLGCAHSSAPDIAPEFQPYVKVFEEEASKRSIEVNTSSLMIRFAPNHSFSNNTTVAHCIPYPWISLVEVKEHSWKYFNSEEKEILIFHELGHCLFDYYGHFEYYSHIMNSFLITGYRGTRDLYIDLFFKEVTR